MKNYISKFNATAIILILCSCSKGHKVYDDSHGILDSGKQADFLWSGDLSVILLGSDRVDRYAVSQFNEDTEKDIEKDFSHAFALKGNTETSYCGTIENYSIFKIGNQPTPDCLQLVINRKTRWCQLWSKWQPSTAWKLHESDK